MLLIFLGAGGLGWWLLASGPQTSDLVFVLTDVEVAEGGVLLRHEHVEHLHCDVMTEDGDVLATIDHKRPGAVSPAFELRVPQGTYMLHVQLKLTHPNGANRTVRYLKTAELQGEKVTIRLGAGTPGRRPPAASDLVFVLTELEVAEGGVLLRHEHVEHLLCDVMTEDGDVLATIDQKRPGAVSPASELRIPQGTYMLRVQLKLTHPNGANRTVRYLKTAELQGEKVTIRL